MTGDGIGTPIASKAPAAERRLGWPRLALFASGDFACNLYWQSLSFFLFFFYTEVAGLGPGTAGLLFAIGSVWDGVADVLVGGWAEAPGRCRRAMIGASAPLGLAFVALYVAPPLSSGALAAVALVAHLAFRTLYALVNVPFATLTVQITPSSAERGRIASLRMVFGTGAALTVALVTRRWASGASGAMTDARGFGVAAAAFAVMGTVILLLVAWTAPPERRRQATAEVAVSWPASLAVLAGNRAFVTLNLAAAATTIAGGVLNGSVLYYFTYVVGAPVQGPAAVVWMGLAGAAAMPIWTVLRERVGTRALWLIDAALGVGACGVFAIADDRGGVAAQIFLAVMQVALIGFSFAFWAMLPDTVEWGERHGGRRIEALTFGIGALGQKLAMGAAAGLLGLLYARADYAPGAVQAPVTVTAIRAIMLGAPALAIAASVLAMASNPFRRDTHAGLTAELARREAESLAPVTRPGRS